MTSNDTPTTLTTLVTGARGKSGRRILDRLVAAGVRAVDRSSTADRIGVR